MPGHCPPPHAHTHRGKLWQLELNFSFFFFFYKNLQQFLPRETLLMPFLSPAPTQAHSPAQSNGPAASP